jgi:hypothetical protein
MGKNKTISLDEDTAKIADRLPNFSRFVRQCLIQHAAHGMPLEGEDQEDDHIAPPSGRVWGFTKDKCNPQHKTGRCVTCWGQQ